MNHPPPSGNYAPTQLLGTSLLAGDPEPISWLHVFRLYVLFVGFVGTEPKLSNPVFCFLQVSDSLGIAAFLYFLLLFEFFFYIHVLFPERIEGFRTTDVTSEPPRIEGLLTALANVPGVPPFPLV